MKFKGERAACSSATSRRSRPTPTSTSAGWPREWVSLYGLRAMLELPAPTRTASRTAGDIVVGCDTWITNGCTVMSGVTIGDGAVVGTKAVVAKDVRPYAIVSATRRRRSAGASATSRSRRCCGSGGGTGRRSSSSSASTRSSAPTSTRSSPSSIPGRRRGAERGGVAVVSSTSRRAAPARLPRRPRRPDPRAGRDRRRRQRLARRLARAVAPHHPGFGPSSWAQLGFAGGANRGVRATASPWAPCWTSPTPAPDWLAELPGHRATSARGRWAACSSAPRPAGSRAPATSTRRPAMRTSCCATARSTPSPPSPIRVRGARGGAGVPPRRVRRARRLRRALLSVLRGRRPRLPRGARRLARAARPPAHVVHRLGATTRSHARARFYVARNSAWCAVRCLPRTGRARWRGAGCWELRTNRPRRLVAVELAGSGGGAGRAAARAA